MLQQSCFANYYEAPPAESYTLQEAARVKEKLFGDFEVEIKHESQTYRWPVNLQDVGKARGWINTGYICTDLGKYWQSCAEGTARARQWLKDMVGPEPPKLLVLTTDQLGQPLQVSDICPSLHISDSSEAWRKITAIHPQTGDQTDFLWWLLAGGIALLVLVLVAKRKVP